MPPSRSTRASTEPSPERQADVDLVDQRRSLTVKAWRDSWRFGTLAALTLVGAMVRHDLPAADEAAVHIQRVLVGLKLIAAESGHDDAAVADLEVELRDLARRQRQLEVARAGG